MLGFPFTTFACAGLVRLLIPVFLVWGGCSAPRKELVIDTGRIAQIRRVAVLPFADGPGANAVNLGNAVAGLVVDRLSRSDRFRVIERSQLKSIMDELDMKASDMIDPATAAKVGKLAGVEAVIMGSVSQYDFDKTVVYIYIIPVVSWSYRVGASVRIIDVNGGDVIFAHSASGSSSADYTNAGVRAVDKLLAPLVGRTN